MLGDGRFNEIISKVIADKKSSVYVFSSKLGLYNPMLLQSFYGIKSKMLLFNRNLMTCMTVTSVASFGYRLLMPSEAKASDVLRTVLSSKSGFENDTFNYVLDKVGKTAYEIGRTVSTVTMMNLGMGYLREHSSGLASFLDYISKKLSLIHISEPTRPY